ncbi:MAG: hypothetical protein U9M89_00910 [Patescibacteria group bacterium]|nr:hypothetical protein [Patescibacteria group bacterium]
MENNYSRKIIDSVSVLNLLLGEYAVVSGGALAARGIREAQDVDILVSEKLWFQLKEQYEVENVDDIEKIIPAKNVEIFWAGSFANLKFVNSEAPSVDDQISRAEIINGVSFQSLQDCLWFKIRSDREKDKTDVAFIEEYLN